MQYVYVKIICNIYKELYCTVMPTTDVRGRTDEHSTSTSAQHNFTLADGGYHAQISVASRAACHCKMLSRRQIMAVQHAKRRVSKWLTWH